MKSLSPQKIRNTTGDDAWFYQDAKGIDVCIFKEGVGTLTARITNKRLGL